MQTQVLLPDSKTLRCDGVAWDGQEIVITVSSEASCGSCPNCGHASERVHSHYVRKLADLPWQGLKVRIRWNNRRFFCVNGSCKQRIFTERLPEVAAPRTRRTSRLTTVTWAIGLACGGEEGARLAERLGIDISPDTVLREIRRSPWDACASVRVLGVDDWAIRRGQRYGTILVDLEEHRVIDLLPERSSESFAAWLKEHPEVEIVSRDRGDFYIKGADSGAPQATQVADRWHLVHNLHEALARVVERYAKELREADRRLAAETVEGEESPAGVAEATSQPAMRKPTKVEHEQQERRARRSERYQQVIALHEQGLSQRAIASQLGMHRSTVRQWLKSGSFPERAARHYSSSVDRWADYLRDRWNEGCQNASVLMAEIQAQGFERSYSAVRRYVAQWRTPSTSKQPATQQPSRRRTPPRSMAWLLLKSSTEIDAADQRLVETFANSCPGVPEATELARLFRDLVTERRADELDAWLQLAGEPDVPAEIQRFATGLTADISAVRAALTLPWSNGQTEGQVNRLKFVKRQMYGRANFDLLRKRVLATA